MRSIRATNSIKYNFFCQPTPTTPIISRTLSATKPILVIYISLISYYNLFEILDQNLFICYTQLKRVFNAKKYIVSFTDYSNKLNGNFLPVNIPLSNLMQFHWMAYTCWIWIWLNFHGSALMFENYKY